MSCSTELANRPHLGELSEPADFCPDEHQEVQLFLRAMAKARRMSPKAAECRIPPKAPSRAKTRCVRCVDELPCRAEGCDRPPYGDGLCDEHLQPLCTYEKCLEPAVDRISPYQCKQHKKRKVV